MASKKSANTININVISNNINMNKSQENNLHPISNQRQPYKIQPFCLKLNNNNSPSDSHPSCSLSRLLDNLQPSQQQQLLTQKLTDKINTLTDTSISTHTSHITHTLISQLNKKQLLQLLYDDIALTHKINEIHSILKPPSPSVTPPPSSIKIIHTSPSPLQRNNSPLHTPKQLKPNFDTNPWRKRCIELQSKYDQTQHENIQLKSQLKVSKWKWFDIYNWILSLNNKHFTLYSQQLYDNLKIQNINGQCLNILNQNDWIQLGVTDTDNAKLLMQQISKLFTQDIRVFNDDNKANVPENALQNKAMNNRHITENIEEIKQETIHAHSKLSETDAAQIKIIDRRTAFIVGLPSTMCNDKCLRTQFGRFGTIINDGFIIGNSAGSIAANSRHVRIYFETEQSVIQLIDYVNNYMVLNGMRVCKATFGFTCYCLYWLIYGKCMDKQCRKIHNWCKQSDIMTDEMIKRFRKMPCGSGTRRNKSNIGMTSRELTQMQSLHTIQSIVNNNNNNNESMNNNNNIIITQQAISQQVQINSLQQQLQMIRARTVDEMTTLKKQLAAKSSAYDSVCNAYKALQIEAETMQLRYCVLDHKCMELEKELNGGNMGQNVEEQEVKNAEESNNNCKNYKDWNFDDVYSWIISLNNGNFQKYKMIYNNLKIEEIDGKCLGKLDKGDIHRIGITGFRDKLLLMEYIQKLMSDDANI